MSGLSAIEWTEATWNPLTGCTHVSEGCDNCYAAREASGRLKNHPAYKGLAKDGKFTGEVRLLPERLEEPLRWRKPRLVFVNSMSDLFNDDVPDEFIAQVFARMWWSPRHTFQVLTKRPARMARVVPRIEERLREREQDLAGMIDPSLLDYPVPFPWPLPNVWLGTSVENQKWADVRIPHLLKTPAAVRFLSCEPLLGPVDLTAVGGGHLDALRGDARTGDGTIYAGGPGIDWVIVGGESGPGARPMHPDWARSLRDQSVAAGVPFFFKQHGEWIAEERPGVQVDLAALAPNQAVTSGNGHDSHTLYTRVGKKAAGRKLDGRTWDEMPRGAA